MAVAKASGERRIVDQPRYSSRVSLRGLKSALVGVVCFDGSTPHCGRSGRVNYARALVLRVLHDASIEVYLRRWVRVSATGLLYRPKSTGRSPLTWRTGPGFGSRSPFRWSCGGACRYVLTSAGRNREVYRHGGLGSRAQALLWQRVAGPAQDEQPARVEGNQTSSVSPATFMGPRERFSAMRMGPPGCQ